MPAGTADFDWGLTPEAMERLIANCVQSTLGRFGYDNLKEVGIQAEVAGYMQGFVQGRGYFPDITDVLVAALTAKLESDPD
jgi:hypothetical protein